VKLSRVRIYWRMELIAFCPEDCSTIFTKLKLKGVRDPKKLTLLIIFVHGLNYSCF
jgi:hypothetical protein